MKSLKLSLIAALFSGAVHAETYVGLQVGHGTSTDGAQYSGEVTTRVYFNDWYKPGDDMKSVYFGYRGRYFGLEGGYIKLPTYTSHAEANNPSRAIDQEITGDGPFVRGMVFYPAFIEPYAFAGVALIKGYNLEQGFYGPDPVKFEAKMDESPLYYGLGLQKRFSSWSVRLEYGQMDKAICSWWTGERDYHFTSLGLHKSF